MRSLGLGFVLAITSAVLTGCDRDTIRHGRLTYDANEVFDRDPAALALAKAASRGNETEVRRLVAAGAKVDAKGKYGITPLWWAAWANNYDGFSALLSQGADPNAFREEGLPIMHLIAESNDIRFLIDAIQSGGNPNELNNVSGETPLFRTVLLDRKQQTALLLNSRANVNAQLPNSGRTIPMTAIGSSANYQLVFELLQRGADPSLKTSNGRTLADTIAFVAIPPDSEQYVWREKVMEYLRGKGIQVERPVLETPRRQSN